MDSVGKHLRPAVSVVHEKVHIPWFMWSIVCCICKNRFDCEKRLGLHVSLPSHEELRQSSNDGVNIKTLHAQFLEAQAKSPYVDLYRKQLEAEIFT